MRKKEREREKNGLVSMLWLGGALALPWLGGGLVLLKDLAATVGGEVAAW